MMLGLHGPGLASTTRVFGCGCGTWGLVGGGRVGTLLGPEASGPPLERFGVGGGGSVVLVPPFALLVACWWCVGGWWGCCLRSA
jgi:hypothetical protein